MLCWWAIKQKLQVLSRRAFFTFSRFCSLLRSRLDNFPFCMKIYSVFHPLLENFPPFPVFSQVSRPFRSCRDFLFVLWLSLRGITRSFIFLKRETRAKVEDASRFLFVSCCLGETCFFAFTRHLLGFWLDILSLKKFVCKKRFKNSCEANQAGTRRCWKCEVTRLQGNANFSVD